MKRFLGLKQAGFTIFEMLIALGIFSVISLITIQLLGNSSKNLSLIYSQTGLQEELQSASAIISNEVQRALYVFPPQNSIISTNGGTVTVNWSQFNLGTSNRKLGIHGNGTYEVNNAPSSSNPQILAMITAPKDPTFACRLNSATGTVQSQGCYQFVAYYAVARERAVRGSLGNSSTSSEFLEPDTNNSTRWVIMEFRLTLSDQITAASPTIPWNLVGCQNWQPPTSACLTPPSPDPLISNQVTANSLPALTCTKGGCSTGNPSSLPITADAARFGSRMLATVNWINLKAPNSEPALLIDSVDESAAAGGPGFRILMPAETYDARGVFQVRLRLRSKLSVNGQVRTFPADPLSTFASPRNIAPIFP